MSLESLRKRLEAIPKSVREAVQPALNKSGDELISFMKALAETSRDTGALIDSIQTTPAGQSTPPYSQPGGSHLVPANAVAITAGNSKVRYAHLVEYGTLKASAQPFFWPAYRLLKKRIQNRTKRAISCGKAGTSDRPELSPSNSPSRRSDFIGESCRPCPGCEHL